MWLKRKWVSKERDKDSYSIPFEVIVPGSFIISSLQDMLQTEAITL